MEHPSATPSARAGDPALPGRPVPGPWPPGWTVRYTDQTGSTNDDLVAAEAADAPDRLVLAAGHQTAGRGRLDRRWEAPAGANLLASLLLREVPEHPHQLTQRVALAAVAAVRRVGGVDAVLKWPNDVMVGDAKLAGVLAQLVFGSGPRPRAAVVGIGLNVGWAPPGAARLGDGLDPLAVLAALLGSYDELPDDVSGPAREVLATLGRRVRVELPDGQDLIGTAIDVEADGRLVVLDECGMSHRVGTADVVHLRPA